MLRVRFHFFILLAVLALSGCTVGPDFEPPEAPRVDSYTETELPTQTVETTGEGGEAQHFIEGRDIPECWWQLFHSKPLNELIEKGLKNNPTLQAANAALRQSEADLQIALSAIYPFINVQASPTRTASPWRIFARLFSSGVRVARV